MGWGRGAGGGAGVWVCPLGLRDASSAAVRASPLFWCLVLCCVYLCFLCGRSCRAPYGKVRRRLPPPPPPPYPRRSRGPRDAPLQPFLASPLHPPLRAGLVLSLIHPSGISGTRHWTLTCRTPVDCPRGLIHLLRCRGPGGRGGTVIKQEEEVTCPPSGRADAHSSFPFLATRT